MERIFDRTEVSDLLLDLVQDSDGSCHTCQYAGLKCDLALPYCSNCLQAGTKCGGYGIRPKTTDSYFRPKRRLAGALQQLPKNSSVSLILPPQISILPSTENYFVQHYLKNVTRCALAVDYESNGYRSLVRTGIHDTCLSNALFAIAASHHSKWQNQRDAASPKYSRNAIRALQVRLRDPELKMAKTTLECMMVLMTYEIFDHTKNWKIHWNAIAGWISSRNEFSDLDPFLKTWIALVDTQSALNSGANMIPQVRQWLEASCSRANAHAMVDPVMGCSVMLPRLMALAADLYSKSKKNQISSNELNQRVANLQQQILATQINLDAKPQLVMTCQNDEAVLTAVTGLNKDDMSRQIVAVAELFRHACHVYVWRIAHESEDNLPERIQESVDTMFKLLPLVPDVIGPGSNLGWVLTVLGAEVDEPENREYIRGRLMDICTLGMYNPKAALNVLERVWSQRDLSRMGYGKIQPWQEVMADLREDQILV